MTVGELKLLLEAVQDDEMLVGATSPDEETCEIQFAGVTSDEPTGTQYFLIHPNGGFPLFGG